MNGPMHSAEQAAGLANPTEARAGAHAVGIPEGGRFAHSTVCSAEGSLPPVDQQAPQACAGVSPGCLPSVFASPEIQEAGRSIRQAASEAHYPLVLSASQMDFVERAVSDALDAAIQAMSDEPYGRDEIQPYVDAYNQLYRIFKAAKVAKNRQLAGQQSEGITL